MIVIYETFKHQEGLGKFKDCHPPSAIAYETIGS